MRYIVPLVFLNVLLIFGVFTRFIEIDNNNKMQTLDDVSGMHIQEACDKLKDYDLQYNYIESDIAKDYIISSVPKANSLVQLGQTITLSISLGYICEKYRDLEGTLYQDNVDYLDYLKENYQIKVIIKYEKSDYLLDGLVKQMSLKNSINKNDELVLTIVSNPKTIIIPDFVGRHYQDVLAFADKNGILVKFYFIECYLTAGYVVSQSIKPGASVLKNGCYLEIYLQE